MCLLVHGEVRSPLLSILETIDLNFITGTILFGSTQLGKIVQGKFVRFSGIGI